MTSKNICFFLFLILITIALADPVKIVRDVHSTASGRNNQRTIVRNSQGHLFVCYCASDGSNYQVYIARSTDEGNTWEPTWATITDSDDDERDPTLAIDSYDTLHVVWRGNISSGNDADLMYTRYPNPVTTTICAHSGYPGAYCPSLAVGPDDDLHVTFTGCPSSWEVRYVYMDRATYTWGTPEDIGPMTPSRWPSIEVDSLNRPHVVYRNEYSGNYHAAHRMKTTTGWKGFNGEDFDTLDMYISGDDALEYTSVFIDSLENVHAIWQWMDSFASNPDTIRYRRYDTFLGGWQPIENIFGNSASDSRTVYNGDVIASPDGQVFIVFHDNDSIFCKIYHDWGASFNAETLLTNQNQARFPNARGSKYPQTNRPISPCIDYVYVWSDPDSAVDYLMFDHFCAKVGSEETTYVCGHFAADTVDSAYIPLHQQTFDVYIGCCPGTDTTRLLSDTSTVEYFDSVSMSWEPVIYPDPTIWLPCTRIDDARWVWDEDPAGSYSGEWFRTFLNTGCEVMGNTIIRIQCDNQATIYVNGVYVDTTHGNSGTGMAGWRTMYEFDLTPYVHGGEDTITIMGYNSGGDGGLLFEIISVCSSPCCGSIVPTSIGLTINDSIYALSYPEMSWDGESTLTFTALPPDTFEHSDTIAACIVSAGDTCGGLLFDTFCVDFAVSFPTPDISIIVNPDSYIFRTCERGHDSIFSSITVTNNGLEQVDLGLFCDTLDYFTLVDTFYDIDADTTRGNCYGCYSILGRFQDITPDSMDFNVLDFINYTLRYSDSDSFGTGGRNLPSGDSENLWLYIFTPEYYPLDSMLIKLNVIAREHLP